MKNIDEEFKKSIDIILETIIKPAREFICEYQYDLWKTDKSQTLQEINTIYKGLKYVQEARLNY